MNYMLSKNDKLLLKYFEKIYYLEIKKQLNEHL